MSNPSLTEAAKLIASVGGSSRSKKKQRTARENGKLGGRPKKKEAKRGKTSTSKK